MHRFTQTRSLFFLLLVPLLAVALVLMGCDSNGSVNGGENGESDDIEVPSSYTFDSRFVDGESAVAYPGQVTRNLLIADLKTLTDGRGGEVTEERLLDRYQYDSQDLDILLETEPPPQQSKYADVATGKSLEGKATASYSDEALIGISDVAGFGDDATAHDVVTTYFSKIADNYQNGEEAPTAYTTDEGVDMSQVSNKLLLGAVAYSQGTAKYLDDVLDPNVSENSQDGNNPYSTLGHVWDEAFGYFGAAREFNEFFDDSGLQANALDRNGDGEIDLNSEYVYTWADYAVDRGSVNDIGFHEDAFEAFRAGRTAIINEASIEEIRDHADDARAAWEKVVAANAVHYLNAMESDLSTLSDDDTVTREALGEDTATAFNTHWAEGKTFAWVLQYNADKEIGDDELQSLHAEFGGAPSYGETKSEAVTAINNAKDILQSVYGFPDENMSDW